MSANLERYGLFKWLPEGFPEWVEATPDVDRAKKRIRELFSDNPDAEYFVQDFIANVIVASSTDHRRRAGQELFASVVR